MDLAIVGSRYTDMSSYDEFCHLLDLYIQQHANIVIHKIITGDAKGIDAMARYYAQEKNIPCIVFPAKWDQYGKAAGPIRNKEIVQTCTHMVAMPSATKDSPGTMSSIYLARAFNKDLTIFYM